MPAPERRDDDPREQLARATIVRRLEHVGVGVVEEVVPTSNLYAVVYRKM